MGHCFTRSHWKVKDAKTQQWGTLKDTPCFAAVGEIYLATEAVRTTLKPTCDRIRVLPKEQTNELIPKCGDPRCVICPKVPRYTIQDRSYPGGVPIEKMREFVADIAIACPGVFKQVDEWEFEYQLGSVPNYLKFLGVASLVRCVEEWWLYVEEYFELRERGIPVDVALLCMNLGSRDPREDCGHSFTQNLSTLVSLKNFTIQAAYLDKCDKVTTKQHPAMQVAYHMWALLHDEPWFKPDKYWLPKTFTMTREIYEMLCVDKVDHEALTQHLRKKQGLIVPGYDAIAA